MPEFVMDKEQLAEAAIALRAALFVAREDFDKRGFPISVDDVNYALKLLDPILNLCINKELEEPFDFIAYMGRIMGDHLAFPNIRPSWYHLVDLGRGGLSHQDFEKTDFVKQRLMPKQLRPPPEYEPSPALKERIERDLQFKQGG